MISLFNKKWEQNYKQQIAKSTSTTTMDMEGAIARVTLPINRQLSTVAVIARSSMAADTATPTTAQGIPAAATTTTSSKERGCIVSGIKMMDVVWIYQGLEVLEAQS